MMDVVCTSGKHYPLELYGLVRQEASEEQGVKFNDRNLLLHQQMMGAFAKTFPESLPVSLEEVSFVTSGGTHETYLK